MKFLAIALIAGALSTTAMADPFYGTTNMTRTAVNATVAVSLAPTYVAIVCMLDHQGNPNPCVGQMSVSYGVVTSTSSVLLKEDIKNVEVDAYDFLAGAEKTLALEEMIAKIRENGDELDEHSDEEIVSVMLKFI